jgi:hypothetical protein
VFRKDFTKWDSVIRFYLLIFFTFWIEFPDPLWMEIRFGAYILTYCVFKFICYTFFDASLSFNEWNSSEVLVFMFLNNCTMHTLHSLVKKSDSEFIWFRMQYEKTAYCIALLLIFGGDNIDFIQILRRKYILYFCFKQKHSAAKIKRSPELRTFLHFWSSETSRNAFE